MVDARILDLVVIKCMCEGSKVLPHRSYEIRTTQCVDIQACAVLTRATVSHPWRGRRQHCGTAATSGNTRCSASRTTVIINASSAIHIKDWWTAIPTTRASSQTHSQISEFWVAITVLYDIDFNSSGECNVISARKLRSTVIGGCITEPTPPWLW